MEQRISNHFLENHELSRSTMHSLGPSLEKAIQYMAEVLVNGNKILACGNGGSAADCQHFAAELVGRFERERPALPAIALTTDSSILTSIANDYDYNHIFSKQVNALGQPGDVLLAISTSGNSENILTAINAAMERDMAIVALTGKDGGKIANQLRDSDFHLCVAHHRTARIQEMHILMLHCICDGIDYIFLGEETT